jgi:hypothetical protein
MGPTTTEDTQRPTSPKPSDTQEKRPGKKTSGGRKNAKAHKPQSHISLTLDNVELVVTTVKERLIEVWDNVEKQRASIGDQVQEVKTTLEQLRIRAMQVPKETSMQVKERVPMPETVKFVAQVSANFIIIPAMMFLDEETTHKPLKDIEALDVTLAKIPKKALYKLQVSVAQEI